jgi:hypothetical protein
VLIPFYEQINQTGLDVQMVAGRWLFKLEAIYSSGNENFAAATGGFEYTFTRVGQTDMDLGIIFEYAYDDRRVNAASAYQNDLMAGLRLAVNDMASTTLLAGYIHDLDHGSDIVRVEASRRVGDHIRLSFETGCSFTSVPLTCSTICAKTVSFAWKQPSIFDCSRLELKAVSSVWITPN